MSRWLQQQVMPKYPQAMIFEALEASYGQYPVSVSTCNSWVSKNGVSGRPVLRDQGGNNSVAAALGLKVKDIAVLDPYLRIKFKGQVTGYVEQNQVLSVLSGITF